MLLFLVAYLGGGLTVVSPCILPMLPFVFARADKPFVRSGLPMLFGLAVAFALVASLAAVAGSWAVEANRYGRIAAIVLLAVFGITLLFPALSARLMQPLVNLGVKLSRSTDNPGSGKATITPSLLLGVATGLLWAPCAGPVLGLILTGTALNGANVGTSLLLVAYAAGAATSLALALLVGGKVFSTMKRSLGASEWVRRGLGAAVLAAVVAIALGLDTGFLTRVSLASTASLEQDLLDKFDPKVPADRSTVLMTGSGSMMQGGPAMISGNAPAMTDGPTMSANAPAMSANPMATMPKGSSSEGELAVEGQLPPLTTAVEWLNSPPLSVESLKGKVVLVDFWTYSCVNCLRAIPYVRAWAEKYRDQGLVVIGVHTPEFAFEKDVDNVRQAIADLDIAYPVAIDNDYGVWRAFKNRYWPAHYFIDAEGQIRHHRFGEGAYDESERVIQRLLAESCANAASTDLVKVSATGAEAASNGADVHSPETYVGYDRAENFVSQGGVANDKSKVYVAGDPRLNEWGLAEDWAVGKEHASLNAGDGAITYRFHARDLHLVLGPSEDGKPIRFRVTIDEAAPGDGHGADVNAEGQGIVTGQRLYQLVRQKGEVADRTFQIEFLDPGCRHMPSPLVETAGGHKWHFR